MIENLLSKNPATGELIAEFSATKPHEIEKVFKRAHEVFEQWSRTSLKERVRALTSFKQLCIEQVDSISDIITKEMGKPLLESYLHEVFTSVEYATYFENQLPKLLRPQRIPLGIRRFEKRKSMLYRMPYGTTLLFPPPGAPFADTVKNVYSPILAGNSVVVKAPLESVAIIKKIEELFKASDFPDGLVQFVYGDSAVTELLLDCPFDIITYMGTREFGEYIAKKTVANHPKLIFEFEASDPMILTEEANLEMAVRGALFGAFANAGQLCTSTERIYVHESLYDAFAEKLINAVNSLRVGDGVTEVDMGPVLSREISHKAQDVVEKIGGTVHRGTNFTSAPEKGNFVAPTIILEGVVEDTQKLYGPLVYLQKYASDSAIIDEVNRAPLARSVSLWCTNLSKAEKLAEQIRRPSVLINEVLGIADPRLPWQGVSLTGQGVAHGTHALWDYTYEKHLHTHGVPRNGSNEPPFWFPYGLLNRTRARSFLAQFNGHNLLKKLVSITKYYTIFKK